MAGDWIKIEHTLPEKPEVDRLSDLLQIDPDTVVGKLARVWIWADQHSLDGNAISVTEKGLDRRAGLDGFAAALRKVGWLEGRDASLSFPNFSRHNGQTSKARALTKKRVDAHRGGNCNAPSVTPPLPEKRREEKKQNTPLPPEGDGERARGFTDGKGADSKLLPTTPQSLRIAAIMHRRADTPWTEVEVTAYKKLKTVAEEDLAAVEAFYASNWPPQREVNHLRHNLITFLNNFPGEVGKAHAWKAVSSTAQSPIAARKAADADPARWREFLTASGLDYATWASTSGARSFMRDDFWKWERVAK